MRIRVNDTDWDTEVLLSPSLGNKYPDFVVLAGGKVVAPHESGKFRITVKAGDLLLKRWNAKTSALTVEGDAWGNMFEPLLIRRDDLQGTIEIKVEVDTGEGFQPVGMTYFNGGKFGTLRVQVIDFDDGQGAIAHVSIHAMKES
jgi:hypothetical protein